MSTPQTTVHLTRAFSGPRHSTLEFLWDCYSEWCAGEFRLCVFDNPGGRLSHAACMKKMWEAALSQKERYAILTEYDFLPTFGKFIPTDFLNECHPVLSAQYCTRTPGTNKLLHHDYPGAWYVLADKTLVGDATRPLDFSPAPPFNDPCNGLDVALEKDYKAKVKLLVQHDAMPLHYGTTMWTGQHLFWSRHYNDDPNTYAAGFHIGDILRRHDIAVERWLQTAPYKFRQLVKSRLKDAIPCPSSA